MRHYYDTIFFDEYGAKRYYDFVATHASGHQLIELACGTGDMMHMLSDDFDVVGFDLDESMIEEAKLKYPELSDTFQVGNFLNYESTRRYDTAFCIGDSTNYVSNKEELQSLVDTITSLSDHVILDCHHPSRIAEFEDPYMEEDAFEDFEYAYQIESTEENLVHTINFLDGRFETIVQWVFEPQLLINMLEAKGYKVQVYTDHTEEGYLNDGEKIVLDAIKEKQ